MGAGECGGQLHGQSLFMLDLLLLLLRMLLLLLLLMLLLLLLLLMLLLLLLATGQCCPNRRGEEATATLRGVVADALGHFFNGLNLNRNGCVVWNLRLGVEKVFMTN